ncbi:MAG: response regulator [Rhodobacteraceae bacterium]|nr:response regulator [Paracoccaceae bacterium]
MKEDQSMIRVLIVDDSQVACELLEAILRSDPDINVVGIARGGHDAIQQAKLLRPDVITMDLHMPDIDGITATEEIMIVQPTPIVIVSASLSVTEVDTSMRALAAGALTVRLNARRATSIRSDFA